MRISFNQHFSSLAPVLFLFWGEALAGDMDVNNNDEAPANDNIALASAEENFTGRSPDADESPVETKSSLREELVFYYHTDHLCHF